MAPRKEAAKNFRKSMGKWTRPGFGRKRRLSEKVNMTGWGEKNSILAVLPKRERGCRGRGASLGLVSEADGVGPKKASTSPGKKGEGQEGDSRQAPGRVLPILPN